MLRAVFAAIACVSLAGCWVSEERLFGNGDWAHPDLDGNYRSEDANGAEQARVTLAMRPNGLVESVSVGIEDGKIEESIVGLVRIEGGSGRYFLLVDRSDQSGEGDIYLIAHLTEEGALELFWPDCAGTPSIEDVTVERDGLLDATVCTFSSKAALMLAGLEAERFLSTPHVVEVAPMGKLVPDEIPNELE